MHYKIQEFVVILAISCPDYGGIHIYVIALTPPHSREHTSSRVLEGSPRGAGEMRRPLRQPERKTNFLTRHVAPPQRGTPSTWHPLTRHVAPPPMARGTPVLVPREQHTPWGHMAHPMAGRAHAPATPITANITHTAQGPHPESC